MGPASGLVFTFVSALVVTGGVITLVTGNWLHWIGIVPACVVGAWAIQAMLKG